MPKTKVDPATRNSKGQMRRVTKRSAVKHEPAEPVVSRAFRKNAARGHAEVMRQAECAAMLVAVTRLLLNMRGRDYAAWLRSVADDFEATDPDEEHPENVSNDLISLTERNRARSEDGPEPERDLGENLDVEAIEPRRPH